MALAVSAAPTALLCALLYFGADKLFAFLLGSAVTMPSTAGPLLIVLLAANLVQNVSTSLMIHTGFFRDMSRLAMLVAAALTAATVLAVLARFDIVGFLIAYAGVYVCGAAAFVALALHGPIHAARVRPAAA
jgi:hypothetical protein